MSDAAQIYQSKEGIEYFITIVKKDGNCFGYWQCISCANAHGGSEKPCKNEQEARLDAEVNLGPHNYTLHKI